MDERKYDCPECKDTGLIYFEDEKGYTFAKPCRCRAVREAKARLERSGLAKLFKSKSFDTFRTCSNAQLEDAKKTSMQYTSMFEARKGSDVRSLLLCGQVGAGKTHLGTACCVQLIDKGIPVIYMGYREEMTALKSKVTDEAAYSSEMNRYKKAPVLFIDDFLKGKITEADVNIVYEIVNYRYNNNLPLIISTEKKLNDLIIFDEAIGSRLIEMCRGYIIEFEGKELNYRLYKGGVA